MKKSKILSVVLLVIVSLSVLLFTNDVFAATDFTNIALNSNNTTSSTGSSTSTTDSGNTNKQETVLSSSKNSTTNNTVLKTNNTTSTYNNTSLPKTGVEDSMPVVVLVVVLGISAVYAYKKMQDYKNI